MIIPIYIVVKVSFGTTEEVHDPAPHAAAPRHHAEHWADVLTSGNVLAPLLKSFTVATATTVVAILIVSPAAYAISR